METTTDPNQTLALEHITEKVETTCESYQSSSIEGRIVEEFQTVTYESSKQIAITDLSLGSDPLYQSVNEKTYLLAEHTEPMQEITSNIAMTENDSHIIRSGVDVANIIKDDNETSTNAETASSTFEMENNQSIGNNDDVREQGVQMNDYGNEYMLENQGSNVYMPHEEVTNLVHNQVYEADMPIKQDNSSFEQEPTVLQQADAKPISVEEPVDTTKIESVNTEQTDAGNIQETAENQEPELVENEIENEKVEPSVVGSENVEQYNEIKHINQNVTSQLHNLVENALEQSGQDSVEDQYNVKEEGSWTNANANEQVDAETDVNQSKINLPETPNESIEQQEPTAIDNNAVVDNVDLTNLSTASNENESLQNYAVPETLESTEVEGGYTIVEGPSSVDISASEQENSDGSLVLLQNYEQPENYEHSEESLIQMADNQEEQIYLTELREQSESRQSTSSQSSDGRPKRGRKPTYDIPMHVLGHDISKPVESVPNGRSVPKPRLGVKVPYRNLTSQIVSKAEIEKEIMERVRLKQEQAKAMGNVVFARKLTQRLARKIAPSPSPNRRSHVQQKTTQPEAIASATEQIETNAVPEEQQKINNDSDLLAILEGEGDDMPVLPKEIPESQACEVDVRLLEREIALQQLQELPHQAPKQRIIRGRQTKTDLKAPVLTVEASAVAKGKGVEKPEETSTTQSKKSVEVPSSDKENTSKPPKESTSTYPKKGQSQIDLSPSPKKQSVDVEPQVKVNMVLKTYSRKRKTVELSEPFPEFSSPKKLMLNENETRPDKSDNAASDVYVTKSSRVIKKKVIWDPDEVAARSPKSSKSESLIKPAKSIDKSTDKAIERKLTEKKSDKTADKKPSTEKITKDKSPDKKATEKPAVKKSVNEKLASPTEKKLKDASKHNKTPIKNKKSLSEVDRLLMDEGAVKMLYDLKNNDETMTRKKKDVYSVERAHKEIMKKASEIKNDLQQNTSNESPKSLRKKEAALPMLIKASAPAAMLERKMSKDSTRSSLHTPPGSPAYSQSSMLVRRRSSSSISSSDEISIDDAMRLSKKKSFSEVPKPKKIKKNDSKVEEVATNVETVNEPATEAKPSQFNSFSIKKSSKHVSIDLNYGQGKCYCTSLVLEELTTALKKFGKDKDCNVVSITSSGTGFCLGVDYSTLVSDKDEERKTIATELAERIRDFLLCLLNFPKVLVAGIQGECVGLGVTMLPLFDIVIASDSATFYTPYSSLGCVAEAGFLLSSPHLTNHGLATELLFTTQKLTADDVFRRGLVSRLCWPEKYNETLKTILTSISKGSKQSLEATKKQLRRHVLHSTEAAINSETKVLIEHWTSAECQKSFSRLDEQSN